MTDVDDIPEDEGGKNAEKMQKIHLSSRLRRTSDREDALLSKVGCFVASFSAWFFSNCDLIEAKFRFKPSRSSMVLPVPPGIRQQKSKLVGIPTNEQTNYNKLLARVPTFLVPV